MKDFNLFVNDQLDAITEADLLVAIGTLPPWRREKALRFKHLQGRKECTYAYLLLCQALRDTYGITLQPSFAIGAHGKPRLVFPPDAPSLPSSPVHFNLSHCRQAVACVVASCEVGIDIESIGRYKEPLARHVLNDQELADVQQSPNPQLAFARYWTQKEAIVKLTGQGIGDDLRNLLLIYNNVSLHTEEHPDKGYVLTVAMYAPKGE